MRVPTRIGAFAWMRSDPAPTETLENAPPAASIERMPVARKTVK